MASQYTHAPLLSKSSFRVLELYPGSPHDEISYKLHEADWDKPPKYDALSYTWGDPHKKVSTLCDGQIMNITVNLRDALCALRFKSTSRLIWADAICINQEGDPEEKAEQVNNMRSIYNGAKNTVVWLGPDSDGKAATAVIAMQEITKRCCSSNSVSWHDIKHIRHLKTLAINGGPWEELSCNTANTWHSLLWIYSRPWFNRVWILQEATSESNIAVKCGEVDMDWDAVGLTAEYITVFRDLYDKFAFANTYIWGAVWLRDRRLHDGPFLDLLNTARGMSATKQQDKVYGLMCMPAFKHTELDLKVDYRKSVAEAYQDLADSALATLKNVDLLAFVQHDSEIPDEIPSWVPQWDRSKIRLVLMCDLRHLAKRNASRGIPFSYIRNPKDSILKVSGISFDIVDYCVKVDADQWFNSSRVTLANHPVLNFWQEQNSKPCKYPTGEWVIDVYSMVLTVGFGSRSYQGNIITHPSSSFTSYIHRLLRRAGEHTTQIAPSNFGNDDWHYWEGTARNCCSGHSFFKTKRGYLGLGSQALQVGDIVCVLAGGEVPFVLRRARTHYQLVGESYVHGIMDGEVAHHDIPVQTFEIQ